MSVRQIDAVLRLSRSTGSARLVLIALADVASDEGEVSAYRRSRSALAAKANVDASTVRRAIHQLEELGELEVLSTGHGRRSSDYRLLVLAEDDRGRDAPSEGAPRLPSGGEMPPQRGRDATPISPSLLLPPPSPPVAPAAPARKALLPEGWAPDERLALWTAAEAPSVNLELELARFRDHWTSKAERRADWAATWRNWARNAQERADRSRPGRPGVGRPSEPRLPADAPQAGELRL